MSIDIRLGDESNEIGWWSSWARPIRPARGAFGFYSAEFAEALFNRVVFTRPPKHPESSVAESLEWFRARKSLPSFFVKSEPGFAPLKIALVDAGYKKTDRFVVMELDEPEPGVRRTASTRVIGSAEVGVWSRAYLSAFYGEESLLPLVKKKVSLSVRRRNNKLLLATVNEEPAGTMALHTERGFTGLYCLGTVPALRRRGVAGSLLAAAEDLVKENHTKLILQLFESDGVQRFYRERGFKVAFVEEVMTRA